MWIAPHRRNPHHTELSADSADGSPVRKDRPVVGTAFEFERVVDWHRIRIDDHRSCRSRRVVMVTTDHGRGNLTGQMVDRLQFNVARGMNHAVFREQKGGTRSRADFACASTSICSLYFCNGLGLGLTEFHVLRSGGGGPENLSKYWSSLQPCKNYC